MQRSSLCARTHALLNAASGSGLTLKACSLAFVIGSVAACPDCRALASGLGQATEAGYSVLSVGKVVYEAVNLGQTLAGE